MTTFITLLGILGSWLLVGGPVYQAVLELRTEDEARALMQSANQAMQEAPRPSHWWWLFPPARLLVERKRVALHQARFIGNLTESEMATLVAYGDKALGWFLVAAGGLCLAFVQTWQAAQGWGLSLLASIGMILGLTLGTFAAVMSMLFRSRRLAGMHRKLSNRARQEGSRSAEPGAESSNLDA